MKKGPLPLIVGVTGHRDLVADDAPRVVGRVRGLLTELGARYPHTPIVLMSSLAEGADRLVARTALDYGAELFAVLPMKADAYERDFTTPESRDEFRALLNRSFNSTVVGGTGDSTAGSGDDAGTDRDHRYALSGAFLVSYSQIIIALWDGERDELLGGTSQIVRFALQGVPAQFLSGPSEPLRVNETGAVYHVRVGRRGKSDDGAAFVDGWLYPASSHSGASRTRSTFERSLVSLERFNRDAVDSRAYAGAAASSRLLSRADEARLHPEDAALNYIRDVFERADALALSCRNWTHAAMIAIFCAIGTAAVLFSVYTNILARITPLYVAFLSVVAFAFAVNIAVKTLATQDRFQDYRALAEGLRVQFYWRLAQVRESVYDHYLARQEGELDWLRNAMRSARLQERDGRVGELGRTSDRQTLLDLVRDCWVNAEGQYFSKAATIERKKGTRLRWASNVCLAATGIVAIVLSTAVARHDSAIIPALVTALTLTLTGAALLTGYAQQRAHNEHARRYERMSVLYNIAADRLAAHLREHDPSGATAVLLQLGREALAETCDWLLLHRERQIEVPTG